MRKLLSIVFLGIAIQATAQTTPDTRFIQHLVNKGSYEEALFLINQTDYRDDSINYLEGWSHYSLKQLEESARAFMDVSLSSDYYYKSRFFAGYNYTFLNQYERSISVLNGIYSDRPGIHDLKNFQLAGIYLLQGDLLNASNMWEAIETGHPALHQPLIDLKNITTELQEHRVKSPLVAGLLSAIVPGAGKVYAGKKGQGVASFIATVGLGLITWENYRKLGPTHYKTIGFGTLCAVNYAANIYGSVETCKQVENDYQTVMQNQILFNLHIPLRNFFE